MIIIILRAAITKEPTKPQCYWLKIVLHWWNGGTNFQVLFFSTSLQVNLIKLLQSIAHLHLF